MPSHRTTMLLTLGTVSITVVLILFSCSKSPEGYFNAAHVAYNEKDFVSAVANMTRFINKPGNFLNKRVDLCDAYEFRARAYFELRDYPSCIADFNRVSPQDCSGYYPYVYEKRGVAHFMNGQYEEAVSDLSKLGPGLGPYYLFYRAQALERLGKLYEAMFDYREVSNRDCDEAVAARKALDEKGLLQQEFFQLSLNELPFNFTGDDPATAYSQSETILNTDRKTYKGEFETTAAYKKRLDRERQPKAKNNRFYAFRTFLGISANDGKLVYDADKGTFQIRIDTKELDGYHAKSSNSEVTVKIGSYMDKNESYVAQNAFGVAAAVNKMETRDYFIKFPLTAQLKQKLEKIKVGKQEICSDTMTISFACPPEEAEKIKEKLEALFVVKVASLGGSYGERSMPTLSRPSEFKADLNYLNVNLLEIWIYNEETKQVLFKQRLFG